MEKTLDVQLKAGFGYGDFITNLAYCYNAAIKYDVKVNAIFHWDYDAYQRHSKKDPESIIHRFYYLLNDFDPESNCTINTKVNSPVDYRFINNLDYQNSVSSYYALSRKMRDKGFILIWRSTFNTYFPGYAKDPIYDDWDNLIQYLQHLGYTVKEVTYQTPINKVVKMVSECSMGIGYDGMIHQLFKCYQKPLLVFCQRYDLNSLLVPHAALENNLYSFKTNGIEYYRDISNKKYDNVMIRYYEWLIDKQDCFSHPLYNKKV